MNWLAPDINWLGLAPEILIVLVGLLVMLLDPFLSASRKQILAHLSWVGVLLTMLACLYLWDSNIDNWEGMSLADNLSLTLKLIFLSGTLLTIFISSFRSKSEIHGEYYALLLLATFGMMLMGSSTDLVVIFLGIEVMSVALYVLAGFNRPDPRSGEASMKYFLMGAFSTGFLLYGIALIYGATGQTNLVEVADYFYSSPTDLVLLAGIGLLLVGLGFKVASVPFHMWAPDVYEGAPTPITAFMSTAAKAGAFAPFVRIFLHSLAGLSASWSPLLAGMAVLSMIVGTLLALVQRQNIKRLLAYSSIVHVGYLLLGLLSGGAEGGASILFYLLAYTFMQVGAFAVVIYLGNRGEEDLSLAHFSGVAVRHPVAALAFSVFLLSLAGIPPTAGFVGKFYIFSAAVRTGHVGLAIVGVLTSVVSLYYYLGVIVYMYMRDPIELPARRPSVALVMGLALAAVGTVEMGLFPGNFLDLAQQSVARLLGS